MKRQFANIRARVTTPPLQLTLPAHIAQKRIGLDLMTGAELEAWWANVWRERGLPDPAGCTPDEFKEVLRLRPHRQVKPAEAFRNRVGV